MFVLMPPNCGGSLVQLAEADAFREALGLARREALWTIKALRDEPLPLFAAAAQREAATVPEIREPVMALRPMAAGAEVVDDYGHVGLTLRYHPVSFLRGDLTRRPPISSWCGRCQRSEIQASSPDHQLLTAAEPRPTGRHRNRRPLEAPACRIGTSIEFVAAKRSRLTTSRTLRMCRRPAHHRRRSH
jgi:hypothetical protein